MKRKYKRGSPKTIGELRQRLEEMGNPWQVSPQFSDDDPLPDLPRGGQNEEETPGEFRLAPLALDADLLVLIAAQPPANPFLRARWVEVGLIKRDEEESLLPEADESGEEYGGAA